MNMARSFPTERAFRFIRNVAISKVDELSKEEVISLLPALVRMAQCQSIDESANWQEARKEIQKVLCGLDVVNSVVALLSVDFGCLRQDCLKEQQLQRKLEGSGHSSLVESLKEDIALEFERSEPSRKLRLVLGEILRIMNKASENGTFTCYENCELFECNVYLDNVCDVMCIAQAELPEIFPMDQLTHALLRVPNGPWFICNLVANAPDYFEQVCSSLLTNQESKHDNPFPSYVNTEALCHLCKMNPDYALSFRSEAVQKCCLPELTIKLTLDFQASWMEKKDLVDFLGGLLLGSDLHVRKWFAHFIKSCQKHHGSVAHHALEQLRAELLFEVISLTPEGHRQDIKSEWQKDKDNLIGAPSVRRRITVDEHDKETLEIIEAMDVSTDFEIVNETNPRGNIDDVILKKEQSSVVQISEENVIYATGLLRLYCALKGIAGMKLTNNEADELMCLITSQAPSSAAGVRFVVVGFCTVLACSFITSSSEREKVAVKWIENLSKAEEHNGGATSDQSGSFGERLLLTAIHFHSNNLEAITDLVSSTLGMRVRPGNLTRIKTIFTQDLFPEKAITDHAVRVPVSPQLKAFDLGFLPVHCVYHLLKNRAFTKHSVQVKDWVYNQILNSSTPLHPLLVNLIDIFVTSIVMPLPSKHRRQGASTTVEGFSEANILAVFENQNDNSLNSSMLTSQLLLLYYLLTYKDCCLSNMKSLVSNNQKPSDYSPSMYSQIPIKYLLQRARKDQNNFRDLYPPLLKLLVTYFPQLCLVEDWICEEDRQESQTPFQTSKSSKIITVTAVNEALSSLTHSPQIAVLTLLKLTKLEPRLLIPHANAVVNALSKALNPIVSRRIKTLLYDLWMKLNTMIPRRLWLATVNTLCNTTTSDSVKMTPYNDDELTKDPLTVLRCRKDIFRSAPLFSIIIRVLMGYLAASRAMLGQHILANSNGKNNGGMNTEQEREELKCALLAAQESAIVQILLEICLPSEQEKLAQAGSMRRCELREIQCIVCSTLHQMFISEPKLAKLVHFQGYDPELLPVTVSGIPSMHICLNFITELLNQPELEKQLFAVQLSSYLCVQFPLPKALDVVKCVMGRLALLCEALSGEKCAKFFIPTSPCLIRFCQAFPPLCMDTSSLLLMIGRTTASRVSGNCGEEIELCHYHNLLEELNQEQQNDRKKTMEKFEDLGFDEQKDVNEISEGGNESQVVLYNAVRNTFKRLINLCVLQKYGVSNNSKNIYV